MCCDVLFTDRVYWRRVSHMEEKEIPLQVKNANLGKKAQSVLMILVAILFGGLLCVFGYMLGNNLSFTDVFDNQKKFWVGESPVIPPRDNQEVRDQLSEETISTSTATSSLSQTPEERIGITPDSGYRIQFSTIYYQTDYVQDIDFETALYIGDGYIKDSKRVFYNGKHLVGADPSTCTKETIDRCAESMQWKTVYSPYTLDVAWNNQPVSATEVIPAGSCRNEGYVVGQVKNGPLAGGAVLVQNGTECGMWCSASTPPTPVAHYVQFNNYLIPVDTTTGFTFSDIKVKLGENTVDELGMIQTQGPVIDIPNSDYWLVNAQTIGFASQQRQDKAEYLFTDFTAGPIYRSQNNCFISTRPDHVQLSYRLGFEHIDDATGVLDFTLPNGTKNSEAYQFIPSYHSCYNVVDATWLKPNERLTKIGEFSNGDAVYKLVNPTDEHLVEKYEDKNTLASYEGGKNKYSYNEYVNFHPYLYWQDPFGGWVEFMNRRFETAAEKCKPVVYLYPEKTGDFSVYVEPNGGFTKTIPEYGTGWHVTATPDSRITDKKTGQTYPYLYWSGINTDIPSITEGWIVKTEDTKEFLTEKLTKLGLNTQEIIDFNEYWIPRFEQEGAQQYKIMFLPQARFEQMSPLRVVGSETPKNVIRVMMYAQPAQAGDVLPEQVLPPTPDRSGFTVSEWGGAMLN